MKSFRSQHTDRSINGPAACVRVPRSGGSGVVRDRARAFYARASSVSACNAPAVVPPTGAPTPFVVRVMTIVSPRRLGSVASATDPSFSFRSVETRARHQQMDMVL